MRSGISIPNFGIYSDPNVVTDLAVAAERSGWDGFFVWDHIVVADRMPVADPWVLLASIARSTSRIRIGPMVTPIPRRRPWVLARQATTVDHLSSGRLVLGVGLGHPAKEEFATFGEPTDERQRADMLDEGLEVLEGMWSGHPFSHKGRHFVVERTRFAPSSVQDPRIPVWVAAGWGTSRPIRRACRYEGVFPVKWDMSAWTADEVGRLKEIVVSERGSTEDFDIVVGGTFGALGERGDDYAAAGATWYLAGPGQHESIEDLERLIESL